ncbi:hypothetical protein [Candidatus Poriferisocius sp.]|uniref:hypothetical protein n=1 Tax=Candidatus Poriferisocius sp. TaxID=3101276 RepID=UPI003B025C41
MSSEQNDEKKMVGVGDSPLTLQVEKPTALQWACGLACLLTIICAPLPWFGAGRAGTVSGFTIQFGLATLILGIMALIVLWYGDSEKPDHYSVNIALDSGKQISDVLESMIAYEDEVMTWVIPDVVGDKLQKHMIIAGARDRLLAYLDACETGTSPVYEVP